MKYLSQGSVIAFGSGFKNPNMFVLDTVFVVRDSFLFDPLDPRKALDDKVSDAFLEVTGGVLSCQPICGTKDCNGNAQELRLYRGATPDNRVNGMFSFFPAAPADRETCFRRPPICGIKQINPRMTQGIKGVNDELTPEKLRSLWDSLVERVRSNGLVLGTHAKMPERRER